MADRRQEIRDKLDAMEPEERKQVIASIVRRINARNKVIAAVRDTNPEPTKDKTSD